jgi:hypothetical protein
MTTPSDTPKKHAYHCDDCGFHSDTLMLFDHNCVQELQEQVEDLQADLAAAIAERDANAKDKERVDWLDTKCGTILGYHKGMVKPPKAWCYAPRNAGDYSEDGTIREVIDAAQGSKP